MTPNELLQLFWAPLGVGLAVVAISAAFGAVRDKFWKPMGRGIRWLLSVRFTTANRETAVAKMLADLSKQLEDAKKAHRDELEGEKKAHDDELKTAVKAANNSGYNDGHWHAKLEVETEREAPRLRPVWRVDSLRKDEMWELRNTQKDAVATDVALECHVQEFAFVGPAARTGPFDESMRFEGHRLQIGRNHGVKFVIRYRDELGDPQIGYAWIDRSPIRVTVL